MTYLITMLILLMQNVGDDITFHTLATHEDVQAYTLEAHGNHDDIKAWTWCDNGACDVYMSVDDFDTAMSYYDAFTTTSEHVPLNFQDKATIRLMNHELLHVLDYMDNRRFEGSFIGRNEGDIAHAAIHDVLYGYERLELQGRLVR